MLPDPLHPAVVHFPIVLILLGAGAAIVAAFWRGGHLARYAALLLAAGALGAWVAVETGESDGGLLESGTAAREALVDEHETWAKRTLVVTIVSALAAAGSALAGQWPRVARVVAIVAALGGIAAVYAVYETGHRGGALVYRHAAGVEAAAVDTKAVKDPASRAGASAREKEGLREREAD